MPDPGLKDAYRSEVDPESRRLLRDAQRRVNWKRWGPYLSERQWGTVREDYSASGDCWSYFPHDQSRSRAYRWGEDGLLGWCDRECRLCFALALWNEKDPILKERLYGLTGPEGNCGEDVKECYYYLDSTPTHSYAKALYKYPQAEFPYVRLLEEARKRPRSAGEFELWDTGIFNQDRYFDVQVEYAKQEPDDTLIRVRITNRGPEAAKLRVLPTLWFRNTWSWGAQGEDVTDKPSLRRAGAGRLLAEHPTLGTFSLEMGPGPDGAKPELLFCENDTNAEWLFGSPNPSSYPKDSIHRYVVNNQRDAVNPTPVGTKASAHYRLTIAPGATTELRLRLTDVRLEVPDPVGASFDDVFARRVDETDQFYHKTFPRSMPAENRKVARQAYAGLLWSKQFYHYVVNDWLMGDPGQVAPPSERLKGRNKDWKHLFSRDVISMPDKWEYPWFAAWDLAFHMIAMAQIDTDFAKQQLLLLLREWYMHPSGAIPAYEFAFDDVNPPVHAWACWRVYKITAPPGHRDIEFLERAFQKLLINFTWWVNRKDPEGNNVFGGGFLGLDNIGVFDRSRPLPTGGRLEQADGTAWVAFYCGTMLAMALELALHKPAYEDIASKFFEHFIAIADAINSLGGTGLWDQQDGFYYDQLKIEALGQSRTIPLRVRSMVGIVPLLAVESIPQATIDKLPGFRKRMEWFLTNRKDVAKYTSYLVRDDKPTQGYRLLAIPTRERLVSVLRYVLDEREFLSPFGVRSLSRFHKDKPYVFDDGSGQHRVDYTPGESTTGLFGGNSNWRGPIWMPLNYMIVEALERYHRFYGDSIKVECPTGSGKMMNMAQVAQHIRQRLCALFLPGEQGVRPAMLGDALLCPIKRGEQVGRECAELVLFHEYFHADTGRGLGASHQTGWTALIGPLLADDYWILDKKLEVAEEETREPVSARRPRTHTQ
jgi:hypothetical protein